MTSGKSAPPQNGFGGGALFPLVIFAILLAWPALERRLTHDRRDHNILDRPRDAPVRTALGLAIIVFVFMVFVAGSADRVLVFFGISYAAQITAYRIIIWVLPVLVFLLAYRFCIGLQRAELVELRRTAAEEEARAG